MSNAPVEQVARALKVSPKTIMRAIVKDSIFGTTERRAKSLRYSADPIACYLRHRPDELSAYRTGSLDAERIEKIRAILGLSDRSGRAVVHIQAGRFTTEPRVAAALAADAERQGVSALSILAAAYAEQVQARTLVGDTL